ncbi:hypothetical protein [Nocardia sp. NPDC004860]|uniref:hypothetical protein n=1 Tax=Nocardia sp. NPDC004860 TaxID=3154557 RepID=UPI0033B07D53
MPDRDIVDAIDELVDEQLAGYNQRSGYDFNVNQDKCPHPWCDEDWHGLKITARMRGMRLRGRVDSDYQYNEDTSPVLCPGSTFEGEFEPPAPPVSPNARVSVWSSDSGWHQIGTLSASGIQFTATNPDQVETSGWRAAPRSFELTFELEDADFSWLSSAERRLTGAAAAVQSGPHWWRCDDIREQESVELQFHQDDDYLEVRRVSGPRRGTLRVGRHTLDLIPERSGHYARRGISADGQHWLEVHTFERPSADGWYLRDEDAILTLDQLRHLRNWRLQLSCPRLAMGSDLDRVHVNEFRREVQRRFPGVHIRDIASTEIERDHQRDTVTAELRWLPPDSRTGEFRGGPNNGRTHDLHRAGSQVDRIAGWAPRPILFARGDDIATTAPVDHVTYVRSGLNTVTGNWVYRPAGEARTSRAA